MNEIPLINNNRLIKSCKCMTKNVFFESVARGMFADQIPNLPENWKKCNVEVRENYKKKVHRFILKLKGKTTKLSTFHGCYPYKFLQERWCFLSRKNSETKIVEFKKLTTNKKCGSHISDKQHVNLCGNIWSCT